MKERAARVADRMFSRGWLGALAAVHDSTMFRAALGLSLGVIVGFQAPGLRIVHLAALALAAGCVAVLWRINWAILALVFLSPFHYAIKELSSSMLVDVWRELLLLLILGGWLARVLVRRQPFYPNEFISLVLVAYLLWGVVEIFNSVNLLVGLAGFRYLFGFVPLYFVARSTITGEREVRRFINAILVGGVIVAVIAVVQFVVVSVLGVVERGTSIDFVRKYAPMSYAVSGIPWHRSNSILVSPNELGLFLAACLVLTYSYCLSMGRRPRRSWLLVTSMLCMGAGLLVSMSRSAILGLAAGMLAVGIVKRRGAPAVLIGLVLAATVALIVAPFYVVALFAPVYTFSDPYFASTLKSALESKPTWESPFVGRGYSVTPSAMQKLRIEDDSVGVLGGVDMYALQLVTQIGFVGFTLFCLGWLVFLARAFRVARYTSGSTFSRDTAAGVFGALVTMMVASSHVDAWGYVSLAATYYLLGAIVTSTPDPVAPSGPAGASVVAATVGSEP